VNGRNKVANGYQTNGLKPLNLVNIGTWGTNVITSSHVNEVGRCSTYDLHCRIVVDNAGSVTKILRTASSTSGLRLLSNSLSLRIAFNKMYFEQETRSYSETITAFLVTSVSRSNKFQISAMPLYVLKSF